MPTVSTVTSRPAESSALAAAIAILVVTILGVSDPQVYQALVVVLGALPAAVTFVVELVRRRSGGA